MSSLIFWNHLFFKIIYCQVQRTKYVEYLWFRISQVWETATCSSKLDEAQSLEVQIFTCLIRQEILLHHVTDQIILVSPLPQSITLSFFLFLLIPSSVFAGIRWIASMKEWTQTETLARPSAWPRTPFLTVTTEILARRTWDCLERCRRTMTTNPKRNRSQNLKFIKWIHAFHVSAFPFSSSCTGGYGQKKIALFLWTNELERLTDSQYCRCWAPLVNSYYRANSLYVHSFYEILWVIVWTDTNTDE